SPGLMSTLQTPVLLGIFLRAAAPSGPHLFRVSSCCRSCSCCWSRQVNPQAVFFAHALAVVSLHGLVFVESCHRLRSRCFFPQAVVAQAGLLSCSSAIWSMQTLSQQQLLLRFANDASVAAALIA